MKKFFSIVPRWLPTFVMMALIFAISSQPASHLPSFSVFDKFVKKGGHIVGYGLLALSYLHGLSAGKSDNKPRFAEFLFAWFLAFAYGLTDEYHQSFILGRHASILDVLVFDNFGAFAALLLCHRYRSK